MKTLLISLAVITGLLALAGEVRAEDYFKPVDQLPVSTTPSQKAEAPKADAKKDAPAQEESNMPDPGGDAGKAALKSFSGIVNVIRQGDRVEVVFRGDGSIFYLPHGSKQAKIFNALSESERSGSSVSIRYDSRTSVIDSVN